MNVDVIGIMLTLFAHRDLRVTNLPPRTPRRTFGGGSKKETPQKKDQDAARLDFAWTTHKSKYIQ
jgi:hypothetical protein